MKRIIILPFLLLLLPTFNNSINKKEEKPKICLTFDDGNINDVPGYTSEEWNNLLLKHLHDNDVEAILFVMGNALDNDKGKRVIESWSREKHLIANHTYSHKSYNSAESTCETYRADFLKNDSLIRSYKGYTKLFRFPYLKEGNTNEKRDAFRAFLKEQDYSNGYVTVDASDWYINDRLIKRLKENPQADIEAYRQFYLDHLWTKANDYNDLAVKLTGRKIKHSLLLHHNFATALFTGDLIKMFRAKGWDVIDASEAYKDMIYKRNPDIVPAGESLIWALAKENGSYEKVLRYPAEDGKYEQPKMDSLGL